MKAFKALFQSRRFVVGMAAVLAAVANDVFKLEMKEETIFGMLTLAGTFMVGTAVEDYAAKRDVPPPSP